MSQVVLLTVGEKYQISRGYNASTGYQWITGKSEGLDVNVQYSADCEQPGCGGHESWTISASKEGAYLFSLYSAQTWTLKEGDHPKVESYLFRVSDKDIITIYLSKGDMVGYKHKQITYSSDGIALPKYDSSVDVYLDPKLKGTVIFYRKGDEYFYLHRPSGADVINTLYSQKGIEVGVPSGGLIGRGDGKISMQGMIRVGQLELS